MKKFLCFLFVLIFLTINVLPTFSQTQIPQWIRIGIYYADRYQKSKPATTVSISANKSIYYAISDDKSFSTITNSEKNKLVVSKDVYSKDGLQGANIHIMVGRFLKYLDAVNALKTYSSRYKNSFVGYVNGSYSVLIGCYDKADTAKNIAKALAGATLYSSKTMVLVKDEGGKVLFGFDGGASKYLMLIPYAENGIERIKVGDRWYRGRVEFKRLLNSDMTVINVSKFEEYLYGVIRMEIDPLWNFEVVKAFAVVARTYAVRNLGKHSGMGFDLCPTDDCQVYGGAVDGTYGEKQAIAAVDSTKGEIITYKGVPIEAVYFSSTGGIPTEDSENVWKYPVEYLRSVDNSKETPNSKSSWTFQWTRDELKEILKKKNVDVGNILDIRVLEYTKAGRVLKLKIIGTKGEYECQKESARLIFNLYSQAYTIATDADVNIIDQNGRVVRKRIDKNMILKDDNLDISFWSVEEYTYDDLTQSVDGTVYDIAYNKEGFNNNNLTMDEKVKIVKEDGTVDEIPIVPTVYTFNGKGWGHGVGMSQWGAKGLADAGYNYRQIIKHYYTGVEIEKR